MLAYNNTDQQLHLLSQPIAKANRTYVASKPDDSHTNLNFNAETGRIEGRWIEAGDEKIMLTLNLDLLQYEWLNIAGTCIQSLSAEGKTLSEVENELAGQLKDLGLDPEGFTDKLHFEIPEYSFADESIKPIGKEEMSEWKSYRRLANELCTLVLKDIQGESEIRIWPHHFDTGIYVKLENSIGLGLGLAMEDSMAGAPYFYMSGYSENGSLNYNNLPELTSARWEIGEYWQGAILLLTNLKNGIFEEDKNAINDYLSKSLNWFSKQH